MACARFSLFSTRSSETTLYNRTYDEEFLGYLFGHADCTLIGFSSLRFSSIVRCSGTIRIRVDVTCCCQGAAYSKAGTCCEVIGCFVSLAEFPKSYHRRLELEKGNLIQSKEFSLIIERSITKQACSTLPRPCGFCDCICERYASEFQISAGNLYPTPPTLA